MQTLQEVRALYAQWEQRVKGEGRREGEERGLITGIEALCGALDLEFTAERRAWLATLEVEQLEELLQTLKATKRWPTE